MSGLLRRLTRRRAATADETRHDTPAASEPVDATASASAEPGGEQPVPTGEQPTVAQEATAAHDLPAGVDPGDLAAAPGDGARRGRVRRRVRYLHAAREVLLRDLGGFAYEIHRTAGGSAGDSVRRLLDRKAERLAAIDRELRALEGRLGEPAPAETVLRQPGIGGTCPECGELYGSEAAFCWHCGAPLTGRAVARRRAAAAAPTQTGSHGVPVAGAREAATSEQPTAERLALWMQSRPGVPGAAAAKPDAAEPKPGAAEPGGAAAGAPADPNREAGAEPRTEGGPADRASTEPAATPKPKRAAKKPATDAPAKDAPADEQPTAVERPSPTDGDPLAARAEGGT
jgi:hypothetical protein